MNPISYGKQQITDEDIQAVIQALQSDYLTQGPKIAEFEAAFANYIGCEYAVAVSNGTAALHLCTLALGVNIQSNVITTPITFAASANCVRYCGGTVWFADIDPVTLLLDINKVEALIASKPAGFFDGIIPVDFAGYPINLQEYKKLADKHNLWLIEDACHAPGGYFTDLDNKKQFCGNGLFADASVFSFHPVKHIACGEGGMITTNNPDLYEKLVLLRTHGITKNPDKLHQNDGGWYYEMEELGYNYRLTDFQAALGISQLKRAGEGLERRRQIATTYAEAFDGKAFVKAQSGVIGGHAYHLYILQVDDRLGLYNHLREELVFAQIHYIPCHLMPYYKQFGWREGDMPKAESYYKYCISLPMYPGLTDEEQQFVITTIVEYYQ